jgi:hypothetical protein
MKEIKRNPRQEFCWCWNEINKVSFFIYHKRIYANYVYKVRENLEDPWQRTGIKLVMDKARV